jgi:hypothetical protein
LKAKKKPKGKKETKGTEIQYVIYGVSYGIIRNITAVIYSKLIN